MKKLTEKDKDVLIDFLILMERKFPYKARREIKKILYEINLFGMRR